MLPRCFQTPEAEPRGILSIKTVLLVIVSSSFGYCQSPDTESDTIRIQNGSFEVPNLEESGWIIMGDQRFTPPDIHSSNEVLQNLKIPAYHGEQFLSMVTRNNGTNEQIGQYLEIPLVLCQA